MPRPKRLDFANARHHVMNRGARRQPIFVHDNCCVHFLRILADLPDRFGLEVHGFALMPNHFHLMVKSVNANLSNAMAYLTTRYSRRVNKLYS